MIRRRKGVDQLILYLTEAERSSETSEQTYDPVHFFKRMCWYPVRQFYEAGERTHRRLLYLTSERNFVR